MQHFFFFLFLFIVCIHAQYYNEGNTAYIELKLAKLSTQKELLSYTPFEQELQFIIAVYMGVSPDTIQVLQVIPYIRADFKICGGDIASFLNGIATNDTAFTNTMLQDSSVEYVLWNYPCTSAYSFQFSQTLPTDGTSGYSSILYNLGLESSDFSSDYDLDDIYGSTPSNYGNIIIPSFILLFILLLI